MSNSAFSPHIVLIDGSSYLYRAFYALPPLTNSKGEPTGAIYGVMNMIRRLAKDYANAHIAVVFDAPGKTFRDELFDSYKASRQPTPIEIVQQFPYLQELVQAFGFPTLQIAGVEADDVIGTIAVKAASENKRVLISTGDKDMAQLVNERINLFNTMSQKFYDREAVKAKFDVYPEQIIDYLALVGDTSDNIPGIPKVGPKTAAKWLNQYGSLVGLQQHANELTGVVGENFRKNQEQLMLSQKLATIKLDVDVPFNLGELYLHTPNLPALIPLLKRLEFKSWIKEFEALQLDMLSSLSPELAVSPVKNNTYYECVTDLAQLRQWLEQLEPQAIIAIDTETSSFDPLTAELVGISLCAKANEAIYIPIGHTNTLQQISLVALLTLLKPYLESPELRKIAHNFKYDFGILTRYGISLQGLWNDTLLESYVLNSIGSRHDLDSLSIKYLDHQNISYTDVTGKGAKQISFKDVPLDVATQYAAEDADMCLQLHQYFWPKILEKPKVQYILEKLEIPLISVLSRMEQKGVLIDAEKLQQQSIRLAARMAELSEMIFNLAGKEFNLNSPKQLQVILFEELQLPIIEKTPTGQASTAESVLQELALNYPLPKLILEHRSLSKLKSTYTDALPKQIHPQTGRVHTSYNQATTSTGRLSSTDPNLQNIPVRTEEGKQIRSAFIAPDNYSIVAFDYSQIELRIMAHLSGDEGLLKAFAEGKDIHKATAAEIFHIPVEQVNSEQRRNAKAINFGLIYGMSAYGLSKQLNIDVTLAKAYIERYFLRYPGVYSYMEKAKAMARKKGYVETVWGRQLYIPDINSKIPARAKSAERIAINAPMQGTAADIIKAAMISIDHWLQTSKLDAHMILQVHDELVFEAHNPIIEILIAEVRTKMESAMRLDVPLIVDVGIGKNWNEAK